MFLQLIRYYNEKTISSVARNEKKLAEFIKLFKPFSLHFESIQQQYKELQESQPRLTHQDIVDELTNSGHNLSSARLTEGAPTLAIFERLRHEEQARTNKKYHFFTYYNSADIEQADRYFQALKKEDSNKLMQRIRKMRFQQSKRHNEKKVGIEIDKKAYQDIKSFIDDYGFKTLSVGIMVMYEMANHHFERDITEALQNLYHKRDLKLTDVFISNADTKRIESLIDKELVFFSNESLKYYLLPDNPPDFITVTCSQMDDEDSKIIRQMRSSSRVFLGQPALKSIITGQTSNCSVTESSPKGEVELVPVQNVQTLLVGSDAPSHKES
tara:strand:+ start:2048 stop:3028 length:981 start_codon:yes stop_codon:yes gene_type:complete